MAFRRARSSPRIPDLFVGEAVYPLPHFVLEEAARLSARADRLPVCAWFFYKSDQGRSLIVLGVFQQKREVRHSERSLRSRGITANARMHQMRGMLRKVCDRPCAAGAASILGWEEARHCGLGSVACYCRGLFTPRAVYQPNVSRDSSAPQTPLGMTDFTHWNSSRMYKLNFSPSWRDKSEESKPRKSFLPQPARLRRIESRRLST